MTAALRAVIERLEAGETGLGICAEIDCLIRFPHLRPGREDDFDGKFGSGVGQIKTETGWLMAHNYLGSMDDAVSSVPEGMWWEVRQMYAPDSPMRHNGLFRARVGKWGDDGSRGDHDRPAIALTLASLRARLA